MIIFGFLLLALGGLFCFEALRRVGRAAEGRVHTEVAEVPERRVALVLGCVRLLANGRENLYFRYRMDAAAALYHEGKVRYLLVSGDNRRHDINEPEDMKEALMERGVPENRIVCDYAGLRTLDSVVRLRKVFQVEEAIVVSQAWHAERAIYLAKGHGVDLRGFAARDVRRHNGFRTKSREQLARVKAVMDLHLLGTGPRHLGSPHPIGDTAKR
ncbi:MAG: YdcF family protein [Verrucomicrobia bacterium]|nr:YdcF family protein [Verrucomicrobiota bacterium]MCH8511255.1 YdcF family protein [Kiritimatiellia bacterium]